MIARDDFPTRREFVAGIAASVLAFPGMGSASAAAQAAQAELTTQQFGARHDDRSDDTAALQAAMSALRRQGGGVLMWNAGIARTRLPIAVPDNVRIYAQDATSGIRSIYQGPINNLKSPLLLGNWHPAYLGHRRVGAAGAAPWAGARVDRHAVRGGVRRDQTRVVLEAPFAASRFVPGEVYALISRETALQEDTGVQLPIPHDQSLLRALSVDAAARAITFSRPVGFDSDAGYLVRIRDAAVDDFGLPIGILKNAVIEGLKVYGYNAFGNNCAAAYDCRFSNFGGEVVTPVQAAALAHTTIDGFRGTFTGARLIEAKFGHHDGIIRNIHVEHDGTPRDREAMFSVGEYCRDLLVEHFSVRAPRWNASHLFQIQPGRRCVFSNGSVHAPSAAINPVYFFADDIRSVEESGLRDVEITHGSNAHVVFAGGRHEPRNCFVQRSRFRTTSRAPGATAVAFLGGQGNEVTDNVFDRGGFRFTGARAAGNRVIGNTTDTPVVDGASAARNEVRLNSAR